MKGSRVRARRLTALAVAWLLLVALTTVLASSPSQAAESAVLVPSNLETTPVLHSGDTMDDPAVWVNPTDSARSLVIGNDKGGALESYDLQGNLVQRLAFGSDFWGNVDVRPGVTIGGQTRDLVGAVQSSTQGGGPGGVRFYTVDATTRMLSPVTEGGTPVGSFGEGFCMYQRPTTNSVYGFTITIQGLVRQFELVDVDGDGLLEGSPVRSFQVGSEAEGCVADDDTGALYISEEDVALWRYSAEPGGGTTREAVDVLTGAGGHLANDVEGVTLVDQPDGGGFIIASAQNVANPNASYFSVYERSARNDFVNTFRVANGTSSDDCDRTDGITAVTANLGPAFPRGIFVCQDNNDLPGTSGNQNLKMVRLENVVNLDGGEPPPPPPPPSPVAFVGQSTANSNAATFTVNVPAATEAGDVMLLFASHGNTVSLNGPGAAWTPVGNKVVDNSMATSVWRRVAVDGDAGDPVTFTNGGTVTKAAVTLAAYEGVDPSAPIAAATGAGEPGTTAAHKTPLVPNATADALRVSYWTDKNAATTLWTAPPPEIKRASTTGTGSGRIGTLLTDAVSGMTAGTPASTGGVVGTANATSNAATMWTILLRPGNAPAANQPPVARFTSDCIDLTCSFDGSASTDFEDSISAYAWDFDDGTNGTQVTEEHTSATSGAYDVTLTVTDDVGATNTVQHTVTVGSQPPTAISFVGHATANVNSAAVSVTVPANTQPGNVLLLFASQGKVQDLTGLDAAWTQIGRVVDGDHVTTVWRRVAIMSDAGSTIRLTTSTISKIALTVAAYGNTSTSDPVVVASGVGEPGTSASHITPSVPNSTDGAWRVSYWSDKNAATTDWTAPANETERATTVGTGSGRIDVLLTDSDAGLTAGAPANTGGLRAMANATADKATSWTILLRPGS